MLLLYKNGVKPVEQIGQASEHDSVGTEYTEKDSDKEVDYVKFDLSAGYRKLDLSVEVIEIYLYPI